MEEFPPLPGRVEENHCDKLRELFPNIQVIFTREASDIR
jgi:hypothetical protein